MAMTRAETIRRVRQRVAGRSAEVRARAVQWLRRRAERLSREGLADDRVAIEAEADRIEAGGG